MSRHNRSYNRRTEDSDNAILAAGWAEYRRILRSCSASEGARVRAVANPDRTETEDQMLEWGRVLVRTKDAATRGWLAACRRVHSGVQVIALGTTRCGLPPAYLLRIPVPKSMTVRERVIGVPPAKNPEVQALLATLRHKDRVAAQESRAQVQLELLRLRMVAALTAARREGALKQRALYQRSLTPREDDARWLTLTREANRSHAEHRRKWQMAKAYQARLQQLGYSYDFMTIDTPFELDIPAVL